MDNVKFQFNADDFIIKKRIALGDLLDSEADDVWIELREPDAGSLLELKAAFTSKDEKDRFMALQSVLPELLIDHNFYSDDRKLDTAEVAGYLGQKMRFLTRILQEFTELLFLSMGQKPSEK
jgi:hypothetical protein